MRKDILLWAAVRAMNVKEVMNKKISKVLVSLVAANPVIAFADGDLADMLGNVGDGADSGKKSILQIAQFVGVICVVGGLFAAKAKSKNPSITIGSIAVALVVGAVLIVVPEIIKRSQAQMGLTPVSVG